LPFDGYDQFIKRTHSKIGTSELEYGSEVAAVRVPKSPRFWLDIRSGKRWNSASDEYPIELIKQLILLFICNPFLGTSQP
jgi:hypothetical protein